MQAGYSWAIQMRNHRHQCCTSMPSYPLKHDSLTSLGEQHPWLQQVPVLQQLSKIKSLITYPFFDNINFWGNKYKYMENHWIFESLESQLKIPKLPQRVSLSRPACAYYGMCGHAGVRVWMNYISQLSTLETLIFSLQNKSKRSLSQYLLQKCQSKWSWCIFKQAIHCVIPLEYPWM